MRRVILGLSFLFFNCAICLQAQQNQPALSMTPVAGPVYMLQGGGGNIGIVADPAGIFMIDSMEEELAAQIRSAIRPLPGGDRVRILVNTHWHGNHVNGNKAFGPAAIIIAHENVRSLTASDQNLMGGTKKTLPAGAKIIPGHGPLAGKDELKAFRQMLYDSADIVRGQMKAGKTLDEIKAAGVPDRLAPWTKGFLSTPNRLELVYRSLEKHKPS